MRHTRLFTPQPLQSGTDLELDESAANHVARVLRARVGDPVTLFNGDGLDWSGEITAIDRRRVTVRLDHSHSVDLESPLSSHLGLCLSKGDRFDWAIQKATELGVSEITPLFSERVDVKLPPDRAEKRLAHWRQVVASACEQCGRSRVPTVNTPTPLAAWLDNCDARLKLVLHHRSQGDLPVERPDSCALLVGPEGGLAEAEVSSARAAGFLPLALGPRVMRTETAPVAALAVLGARWGDLAPN